MLPPAILFFFEAASVRIVVHDDLPGTRIVVSLGRVKPPYQISTLLFCFNERDEVLLLKRRREPNRGLWSPCGGKLKTDLGESPYSCACREGEEETGLRLAPSDLRLAGLVSEHGYESSTHWLMFLFEVKPRLTRLPESNAEGRFEFFPATRLDELELPQTDREQIWPLFWRHRRGFFAAHCRCRSDGRNEWTLEESVRPAASRSSHQNPRRGDA